MRTPAILSAGVHVVAMVAAIVNFSFFRAPPIEPEPVMLDFVAIDKHAAAPTIGNPPPQPKDAKIDTETTKAPPPKALDPPPAPEPPKPDVAEFKPVAPKPVEKPKPEPPKPTEDLVAMKPKEPDPPKEEKKPEPPKPEPPKPEVKKVEPPKPPPPKPQPPKPNVDALVDSILKNQDSKTKVQTPEQQPKPVQQVTRVAPAAPQLAAVVTASEVQGVIDKVRQCWFVKGGARNQDMVVSLVVDMDDQGLPKSAQIQDTGRYRSDPEFQAYADAARRAVLNPRCQPWPLPKEKINSWRTITFNFPSRDY
jgi:hypothetical protein